MQYLSTDNLLPKRFENKFETAFLVSFFDYLPDFYSSEYKKALKYRNLNSGGR
jgi:hypothetical protein